jgi:hypothetical protein
MTTSTNLGEGVRRLFLVFQWAAAMLVLAIGWRARPHVGEDLRISEKDWQLDTEVVRQINALVPPPPTWSDWITHMALVLLCAVSAYYLVLAVRKLLVWVCSGFVAPPKRG